MNIKTHISLLLMVLVFPLLLFCAPMEHQKYVKDGKVYGITKGLFRGKWWNHYERGISFSKGLFLNEAEQDFREAVRQRTDDQRRARTYGMHFIDFFPHRELGVVLYSKGEFQEAILELKTSLSTQESAKAKFYLNRARKSLLQTKARDTLSPEIRHITPGSDMTINKFMVTIMGKVNDDGYVSTLLINGIPEFIELAEQEIIFKRDIQLEPGPNTITITAEDLSGNKTKKSLVISGDFKGPGISLLNYMNGQKVDKKDINLKLSFTDESGVKSVMVNGQSKYLGKNNNGVLNCKVTLANGVNKISIKAEDMVGNVTDGNVQLICEPDILVASASGWYNNTRYGAGAFGAIASDAGYIAVKTSSNETSSNETFSNETFSNETLAPELRFTGLLKNISEDELITIMARKKNKRFFVEGQVSDINGIASISINGRPIISQGGKEVIFNKLVDLQEGKNSIKIDAVDGKGNTTQREITVNRKIQTIDLNGSRMTLSVMPFKTEAASSILADSVYNLFVDEIINGERFNVLGRGVELEAILKELKLSRTDLVDKEKAVQTGKLLGSETIMIGTIIERQNSIEMFAKLIDTETSKVIAAHDVFDMNKKRTKLEYLMEGLATKFVYSVPLIDGKILAVKKNKFYLDLGRQKHINIKDGIKCLAYRTEPFIVDGQLLGEDITILGTLLITNVQDKFAIASLSEIDINKNQTIEIAKNDKVITK